MGQGKVPARMGAIFRALASARNCLCNISISARSSATVCGSPSTAAPEAVVAIGVLGPSSAKAGNWILPSSPVLHHVPSHAHAGLGLGWLPIALGRERMQRRKLADSNHPLGEARLLKAARSPSQRHRTQKGGQ